MTGTSFFRPSTASLPGRFAREWDAAAGAVRIAADRRTPSRRRLVRLGARPRPRPRRDGPPTSSTCRFRLHLSFYRAAIVAVTDEDPYAGLILSMHGAGIYKCRYGLQSDLRSCASSTMRRSDDADVRRRPGGELPPPASPSSASTKPRRGAATTSCRSWDRLSLYVCLADLDAGKTETIPAVPLGGVETSSSSSHPQARAPCHGRPRGRSQRRRSSSTFERRALPKRTWPDDACVPRRVLRSADRAATIVALEAAERVDRSGRATTRRRRDSRHCGRLGSRAPIHRPDVLKARHTVFRPVAVERHTAARRSSPPSRLSAAAAFGTAGKSAPARRAGAGSDRQTSPRSARRRIALQTDWFPEAEYGVYFSLIGANGTLDAKKGTYTGPLGKTGVEPRDPRRRPVHRSADRAVADVPGRLDRPRARPHGRRGAIQQAVPDRVGRRAARAQPARARLGSDEAQLQDRGGTIGASGAKILVFTKAVNYVPFVIKKGTSRSRRSTTASTAATRASSPTRRSLQQAFVTRDPVPPEERDQGVRT